MSLKDVLLSTLLITVIAVNSVIAEVNYVLELHQGIHKALKAIAYNDLIIANVDGKAFIINLTNHEVHELVINVSVDRIIVGRSSLIGIGRLSGLPVLLEIYNLSKVLVLKLGMNSTLYEVVKLDNYLLTTGYEVLDSVYRLVIHNLSVLSSYTYVADCHTSCYGRKLIINSSNTFVVGSTYLKSDAYGWSYDVFIGRLEDESIDGVYIELYGNNFVVDAFMYGDLIYVVIDSDPSGVYLAVISVPDLRVTTYRISLETTSLKCLVALSLDDEVIMLIEDLSTKSKYLTILNVSTLNANAYVVGNDVSSVMVFNGSILAFKVLDESKGRLIINDLSNLRKSFNEVKASLAVIKVKSSDVRFNLIKQALIYNVTEVYPGMRYVVNLLNTSVVTGALVSNVTYSKPLYEFSGRTMGRGGEYLLVIGAALIIASVMLKYLINLKGYRS